jgi:hypothetical protein
MEKQWSQFHDVGSKQCSQTLATFNVLPQHLQAFSLAVCIVDQFRASCRTPEIFACLSIFFAARVVKKVPTRTRTIVPPVATFAT